MTTNFTQLIEEMITGLQEAADKFRHYECLHRGKGTPDGDAKAQVNADLARKLEQTLIKIGRIPTAEQ